MMIPILLPNLCSCFKYLRSIENCNRRCNQPSETADYGHTKLNASAFQSVFEYLEENFTIYKLLLSNEGFGVFRSPLYAIIEQAVTEVIGVKLENNAFSNGVTTHF